MSFRLNSTAKLGIQKLFKCTEIIIRQQLFNTEINTWNILCNRCSGIQRLFWAIKQNTYLNSICILSRRTCHRIIIVLLSYDCKRRIQYKTNDLKKRKLFKLQKILYNQNNTSRNLICYFLTSTENTGESDLLFKQKRAHGRNFESESWASLPKSLILERDVWKSNSAPRRMTGWGTSAEALLKVSAMYTTCGSLNLATTASVARKYIFSASDRQN